MVGLSGIAAIVAGTHGMLATGATTGAIIGSITGISVAVCKSAAETGVLVAKSTVAGGIASAIIGSAIAGPGLGLQTIAGSVMASATGATTAGSITYVIANGSAAATSLAAGPLGWLILGADDSLTFDCWKPVLHDDSTDPSKGKLLRDVILDSRVQEGIITATHGDTNVMNFVLRNIWDEQFRIDFVSLPTGDLAAHAVKI